MSSPAKIFLPFLNLRRAELGKRLVVCGLGPSLRGFRPDAPVIGCNDIWGHENNTTGIEPKYLVCIDGPHTFEKREEWKQARRLERIEETPCRHFLAHLKYLGQWRKRRGERGWIVAEIKKTHDERPLHEWVDPHSGNPFLHYVGSGSPYTALSLAGYLGVRKVGIIGADFTTHHALSKQIDDINRRYARLTEWLAERGTKAVCLSEESCLREVMPCEDSAGWSCADRSSAHPSCATSSVPGSSGARRA